MDILPNIHEWVLTITPLNPLHCPFLVPTAKGNAPVLPSNLASVTDTNIGFVAEIALSYPAYYRVSVIPGYRLSSRNIVRMRNRNCMQNRNEFAYKSAYLFGMRCAACNLSMWHNHICHMVIAHVAGACTIYKIYMPHVYMSIAYNSTKLVAYIKLWNSHTLNMLMTHTAK